MASQTSTIVNRSLKRLVVPRLSEMGFQHADARSALAWHEKAVWALSIKAVGNYFSNVTGWPPGSLTVELGVLYSFMPRPAVPADERGRLRPKCELCQSRKVIHGPLDQSSGTRSLSNPAERQRTDIWWIDPDGSNADQVAQDIGASLQDEGLPWLQQMTDLNAALQAVERERDCFVKYVMAVFLAEQIGDTARSAKYGTLAENEAVRIRRGTDRTKWWVSGFPQ